MKWLWVLPMVLWRKTPTDSIFWCSYPLPNAPGSPTEHFLPVSSRWQQTVIKVAVALQGPCARVSRAGTTPIVPRACQGSVHLERPCRPASRFLPGSQAAWGHSQGPLRRVRNKEAYSPWESPTLLFHFSAFPGPRDSEQTARSQTKFIGASGPPQALRCYHHASRPASVIVSLLLKWPVLLLLFFSNLNSFPCSSGWYFVVIIGSVITGLHKCFWLHTKQVAAHPGSSPRWCRDLFQGQRCIVPTQLCPLLCPLEIRVGRKSMFASAPLPTIHVGRCWSNVSELT